MTVLFWVNKFPVYSETFVRDQIVELLKKNVNIYIYSGKTKNFKEKDALKGFENYQLLTKVIDQKNLYPENKFLRVLNLVYILILNLFSKNLKYYVRTINKEKYGGDAKNLHLFFMVHFILKNKIEVIHAHFGPNGNEAAVLKDIGVPIKLLTTFHGYDIRDGIKHPNIYQELIKHADIVFSISEFNYKNLQIFGFKNNQIISLNNGIDVNFFKRNIRVVDKDQITIITVARLEKEKALHLAIEAVAKLLNDNPLLIVEFKIIGNGSLFNELTAQVLKLNLQNVVSFIGYTSSEKVRDLMINADIFILTSIAEALPTVLLEAQACELGVVATDVGAVKTVVKNGVVVEPNNVNAIANGLKELIDKRSQWHVMGIKGRDYVVNEFNITVQTQKLFNYYLQ